MLQLSIYQLDLARRLAWTCHRLESAKEALRDAHIDFEEMGIRVAVPQHLIRAEIDRQLSEAHKQMSDLGIDLRPDTAEEAAKTQAAWRGEVQKSVFGLLPPLLARNPN